MATGGFESTARNQSKSKAGSVQNDDASKVDFKETKFISFPSTSHPLVDHGCVPKASSQIMEACISIEHFKNDPTTLSAIRPGHETSAGNDRKIIELMMLISTIIGPFSHHVSETKGAADQVVTYEVLRAPAVEDDQKGRRRSEEEEEASRVLLALGIPGVDASGMRSENPLLGRIVGFRFRLVLQRPLIDNNDLLWSFPDPKKKRKMRDLDEPSSLVPPPYTIGKVIDRQIKSNHYRVLDGIANPKRNQPKEADTRTEAEKITADGYAFLCRWYSKEGDLNASQVFTLPIGIQDAKNRLNPCNIFSVERSLRKAREFGAHPAFCKFENYFNDINSIYHFRWPFPECVWRLPLSAFSKGAMDHYFLPHVPRMRIVNDPEFSVFCREGVSEQQRGESDSKAEAAQVEIDNASKHDVFLNNLLSNNDRRKAKKYYNPQQVADQSFYGSQRNDGAFAFETYCEGQKTRIQAIKSLKGRNDREKALYIQKAKILACTEYMEQICCKDGRACPCIQAIGEWGQQYLQTNLNFCMPRVKQTKNRTFLAECEQTHYSNAEHIQKIYMVHLSFRLDTLKGYCVYIYGGGMLPHTIKLGPASLGKSNLMESHAKLFINGTVVTYNYMSSKANAASGDHRDRLIVLFEEAPPSMIGVGIQKGFSKDSGNSSDGDAMMKSWMSNGTVTAVVMVLKENGQRVSQEIVARCNSVIFICGNVAKAHIPRPFQARAHVETLTLQDRSDGISMSSKVVSKKNIPDVIAQTYKDYLNRTQYLISFALAMIHAKVLVEPEMTIPNWIFTELLERASKRTKNKEALRDARPFDRLQKVCRIIMLVDAINTLFDTGVLSPLSEEPWRPHHILYLEKFLRGTQEHAVYAFSLLESQWNNGMVDRITGALKEFIFHYHTSKEGKNQARQLEINNATYAMVHEGETPHQTRFKPYIVNASPGGYDVDDDYYTVPFEQAANWSGRNVSNSQDELCINVVVKILMERMAEKPLEDEVRSTLQHMLSMNVPSLRNPGTMIPVLVFDRQGEPGENNRTNYRGYAKLSRSHVTNLNAGNIYKEILADMLSYEHTGATELIYGTLESSPYVCGSLMLRRDTTKHRIIMKDPNYTSAAGRFEVEDFTESVRANTSDPHSKVTKADLKRAYSSVPAKIITGGLDEHAVDLLRTRLGPYWVDPCPALSNVPVNLNNRLIEEAQRNQPVGSRKHWDRLPMYPYDCYENLAGKEKYQKFLESATRAETAITPSEVSMLVSSSSSSSSSDFSSFLLLEEEKKEPRVEEPGEEEKHEPPSPPLVFSPSPHGEEEEDSEKAWDGHEIYKGGGEMDVVVTVDPSHPHRHPIPADEWA